MIISSNPGKGRLALTQPATGEPNLTVTLKEKELTQSGLAALESEHGRTSLGGSLQVPPTGGLKGAKLSAL